LEAWAVRKFEWSARWVEAMLYTAEKPTRSLLRLPVRGYYRVRVTVELLSLMLIVFGREWWDLGSSTPFTLP
jgi:hypothetical protein